VRTFDDIQSELKLVNYVGSSAGNLYIVPVAPGAPRIVVRHFDRDLSPAFVPSYTDMLQAAGAWIERDPALARLVRVEQPVEVGRDFIARRHHLGTPISAYADEEDPPEPPEEMTTLKTLFSKRLAETSSPRDRLIAQVLARSILEPTAKTFFSERENRFVIADLKPTREELERWPTIHHTPSSQP
jgi:hypothetical protein